jgi:hypothetical protein
MISSEVQRTLVKSPPELWSELSDPEALSRHLGGLGEIRITKVEPEHAVEWEAEAAQGRIELKPSGWGTKVTLQMTREAPQGAVEPALDSAVEAEEPQPTADTEPEAIAGSESKPEDTAQSEPADQPGAAAIPELEPADQPDAAVEPESELPRLGFLARLFKRMRKSAFEPPTVTEPTAEEIAAKRAAAEEQVAAERAAAEQAAAERAAAKRAAAEQAAAEEEIAATSTEMLSGVLDSLGAAHHRPFSRA